LYVHLVIGLASTAFAVPPFNYAKALENSGIEPSEQTLVAILTEGIPVDWQSPEGRNNGADERWRLTELIVQAINASHMESAAPVLIHCIRHPLPPRMAADLSAAVESRSDAEQSYDALLARFRAECANALVGKGHESAPPVLHELLFSLAAVMREKSSSGEPFNNFAWAFNSTCRAVARLGSSQCIEEAIALLPDISPHKARPVVQALRDITGRTYGPDFDRPARLAPAEYAKWQRWWEVNKVVFHIKLDAFPRFPPKKTETLRDFVLAAPERVSQGRAPDRGGTEAGEWLAANARSHRRKLRALMDDPDERIAVRVEALFWSYHYGGRRARRSVQLYASGEAPFDEADARLREQMQRAAQSLLATTETHAN
jgi:hypothetical protein